MSELPWNELVTTFQVHPESACYQDIMRLAEESHEKDARIAELEDENRALMGACGAPGDTNWAKAANAFKKIAELEEEIERLEAEAP